MEMGHSTAVACKAAMATCMIPILRRVSANSPSAMCCSQRERTIHPANIGFEDQEEATTQRVCIPIVHALLPGQSEETYRRFFAIVKQVYPQLRPTRFKSDYERAQINAVTRVYPGIKCEGDSFHLFQAITKKVQENKLMGFYKEDIEIYDQVGLRGVLLGI